MNRPDVYRKLSYLYMELAFHQQSYDLLMDENVFDVHSSIVHHRAIEDRTHEINKLMLKIA